EDRRRLGSTRIGAEDRHARFPRLEDWRREPLGVIRAADAVAFLVSPNVPFSPVCAQKVVPVAPLTNPLTPIVLKLVVGDRLPGATAKINYLFFDKADDFETGADELARVADGPCLAQGAHKGRRAGAPLDERNRPGGLTLRGQELQSAEQWIASRPR